MPAKHRRTIRHKAYGVLGLCLSLLAATCLNAAAGTATGSATISAVKSIAPVVSPAVKAAKFADTKLKTMTLAQKVGQLFVADIWGKSATEVTEGNQKKYGLGTAAEIIQRYQVGGVIYFNNADKDNVESPAQVAALSNGLQTASLNSGSGLPLTISTDQEGGRVTRIGTPATEYPSAMAIGATGDQQGAQNMASISAQELRALGINQNFSPDADVNSNPLNPVIGSRSFSSDPTLASQLVAATVTGYQQTSDHQTTPLSSAVSAAAKHFPGHGDAAEDSHTGLPVIKRTEAQWREIDLPPFIAAIEAGVDSIMTAHISVPSLDPSGDPATLSKPIVTGLLRDELNYQGVVVTDSLQMQGVRALHSDAEIPVLAIQAGVDQMLMPPNLQLAIQSVVAAVQSGRISEQRIDESVRRILKVKHLRGIISSPLVDEQQVASKVGTAENGLQVQRISDSATTLLRDDHKSLPLKGKILVTGWNRPDYPGYSAEPVAALAKQLGGEVTTIPTGTNPTKTQIAKVSSVAATVDTVVVLTNGLRISTAQQALLNRLLSLGKSVVAVSVQEPYDAGFTSAPVWLATYDWRDVSMASLAKVLQGKEAPLGHLPVDIPSGTDSNKILFPQGHGLSLPELPIR